jgi:hypothetical protein
VATVRDTGSTTRGSTIDVSNFGGDRCRTCRQHPQGAHHRRLQLRWWPLPDLPPSPHEGPPSTSPTSVVAATGPAASAPQGGPSSTSSTSVVAAIGPTASTPQWVRHRHLQLQWWPLPDLPPAPPEGPPSTSPTSVVAAAGPAASTRHGGLPLTFLALMVGTPRSPALAPPGDPLSMFLSVDGGRSRTFASGTSRGPAIDVS